ncbi:MAG TPA: class I SAM-dependent methyltransferase [Chitinophagaceae bacterium]|nr:class I SAM-dependent methyltransferase [Chitinophagaceae bacterium]
MISDTTAAAADPKLFQSDNQFDQLYPAFIRKLTARHWTPLHIARQSAAFLAVEDGARILDIGSGAGKFCLAAAHYQPAASFYGVEQRSSLVSQAKQLKNLLSLRNAHFLQGNFTQLDFRDFDHFYFYNSFYENLPGTEKIDEQVDYSEELYHYYNRYLYRLLDQKPAGTRLVTFHSLEGEVPPGYHVVSSENNELLKFWIKI